MTVVTPASIAYIAMHLLFALSSSCVFNKFNVDVDLVGFYRSIKGFFYDSKWADESQDLLDWWNRQIFPALYQTPATTMKGSHQMARMRAAKTARAIAA
ncbi:hypothetical protein BKA93DRAFT_827417 [Sparassis latifolia]